MANTFDPSKKQASVTLSNGNLTATGTLATNWETALCVDGYSSGKWYFELTFDVEIYKGGGGAYDFAFGVANLSHNLSNFIGVDANGWSLLDPNSVGYFAGVNTPVDFGGATDIEVNDVVGIALDMDNGKIWWSLNGLWGDSGDPATDTNPQATGLTGTLYPGVSVYGNGSQVTINFGSTDLAYTPPAGFKAPDIPTSFTSVQDGDWDDPETWGYSPIGGGLDENTLALLHLNESTFVDSAEIQTVNMVSISRSATQSKFDLIYSAYFNGGYVTLDDNATLDFGTGNFTIDVWIFPTNLAAGSQVIYAQGGSYNDIFNIFINSNGSIQGGREKPSGTYPFLIPASSAGVITQDAWNHVAVVRNGSDIRIYVDGVSVTNTTFTGDFGDITVI